MINLPYPIIFILFIFAINALSEPSKAYRGNILAMLAMSLAIIWGLIELEHRFLFPTVVILILGAIIGIITAKHIQMPNLPQLVALLNGFGGLAAGLIGTTEITSLNHPIYLIITLISIGIITFSGSLAAFLKLNEKKSFINGKTLRTISFIIFVTMIIGSIYTYYNPVKYVWWFVALCSLWGFLFIFPIGGADMPIVISILNSLSGWSTVLVGFSLKEPLLIITGTIIGASGTILSYMMTKAMNRNLFKIIFSPPKIANKTDHTKLNPIHLGTPRDAAFLMENAQKVIIVPGYGMAASGAQNEIANMSKILKTKHGVDVKFAIHPVAGRMPGHMNVLLAEANVNPDEVFELKDINQEFQTADVAYVIGANDITNPLAKTKTDSPIYQMPVLEVEQAKTILFVKRSLATGYAGIDNPLFYKKNTLMLLGDAKQVTKQIVTDLEQ